MKVKTRDRTKKLTELCEEHKKSAHRIDKKKVNLKAAEGTGDLGGTFTPSSEELDQINQFTRKTVGADDVVAFPTMSCNDLYDRDDERFTPDTIQAFGALEAPYSFTGKSFMSDHVYEMDHVKGRIFDTGTTTVDGVNFVTNKVYVPNTEQYQKYIENIDFGLAWAVSVGVVIDKANCSIPGCGEQVFSSRFFGDWCAAGHEKGYFYVPGAEEDDGWGFFLPVDPETKGAVKARVDLSDPIDAYELSQVFLGAQYFAELAKKPGFSGMIKAASAKTVPYIGLSRKEAEELPLIEEAPEVTEARQQYTVSTNDDGDPMWTDDDGMVWVYVTSADNNGEVMCLGESNKEESDGQGQESGDGVEGTGEVVRADGDQGPEHQAEPDPAAEPVVVSTGQEPDAEAGSPGQGDLTDPPNNEEKAVSKKSLLAAMKAAKWPGDLVDKVEGVEGDDLANLLAVVGEEVQAQSSKVAALTAKAELGEQYIQGLRKDALAWYVKARQAEPNQAVSVEVFNKILDRVGDDAEVLLSITEEQKDLARAKFPEATRRSTFEKDPNEVEPIAELPQVTKSDDGKALVQRIHG